ATAEEILNFCRQNLAKYKVPTRVEFREALPKSSSGKILRRILRQQEIGETTKTPGFRFPISSFKKEI
ncbi:MAG: hypothetical protein EHM27_03230, partial [Deltaproteobacteria bacterium]